jgi:squalene-associated FAD-dependent desaturase
MKTVTVLGGGIAGLAAAVKLADAGFKVTVVEKRNILGGRASSTLHPETKEVIDNCQHVLLKCCDELQDFLKKLGVASKIKFFEEYVFLTAAPAPGTMPPQQSQSVFKATSGLPAPLHLLPSFFKLKFLNFKDKCAIAWAMVVMAFTPEKQLQKLDDMHFETWLKNHFQTKAAIEKFWNVILVSALNESIEKISAKYAFKTFRESFLKSRDAYQMGIPSSTLDDLYSAPVQEYLKKKGVEILFQKKAARLEYQGTALTSIFFTDGSQISSDCFVLALPFEDLKQILPGTPEFQSISASLEQLETSPITGIHLYFDRTVTELDHAILLDSPIQWMFNKTKNYGRADSEEQYIQLVVSASREFIEMDKNQIVQLSLKELERFFPAIHDAKLTRSVVIKEFRATFSPMPGRDRVRPVQKTHFSNLWLAGDWTKTDWPATLESAVRSGNLAAKGIIELFPKNA